MERILPSKVFFYENARSASKFLWLYPITDASETAFVAVCRHSRDKSDVSITVDICHHCSGFVSVFEVVLDDA